MEDRVGGTDCSKHLTWGKGRCSAGLGQLPSILQKGKFPCVRACRAAHNAHAHDHIIRDHFSLCPTFLGIGVCQHLEVFAISTEDVCRSTLDVSGRQVQGKA